MHIKRKNLAKFLNENKHLIPFGAFIRRIEVEEENGFFMVRMIPSTEGIIFDDIRIERSYDNIKKALLKKMAGQEDHAAAPYRDIIRDKAKAAAKRWKKTHPVSKSDIAFLNTPEAEEYFPESMIRALTAVSVQEFPFDSMQFSFKGASIRGTVPGFPYEAEYTPSSGEFKSPFRTMAAWHKKIGTARTGMKALSDVRAYIAEKGINACASYDKKSETILLGFEFDGYHTCRSIHPGKTFKNAVRRVAREAEKEYRLWYLSQKKTFQADPLYGTVLADAVLCTAEENCGHRTPQQICDILRGVHLKEGYTFGDYSGRFSIFSDREIRAVIDGLCGSGLLCQDRVKGFYQNYDVVRITPSGMLFKDLHRKSSGRKTGTELERAEYIKMAAAGSDVMQEDAYRKLVAELLDSPGLFCAAPGPAMALFEKLPDSVKKYAQKKAAGLTSKASRTAARYLLSAAAGKRRRLPANGIDILRQKKAEEEMARLEEERRENELIDQVLTEIPEDYTQLYPLARHMKRKFILHIGPTNSGKTHMAIEDLMKADKGIYLAPLRLLAFEQYEKMNSNGCPCSLVTGEEQVITEGARHQSSTIEMLNVRDRYNVAVIDEGQMIADDNRGGAWTAAVMGVRADTVHVCAAVEAEEILKKVIDDCGDEYTVIRHERMTPLVYEDKRVKFPDDVKKGDALIVFSRKNVHAVASELQKKGISCSIIYGALPYDVRHEQAGKFQRGETDVVVATDAIGMGMNLPIKRVVLMETAKFDGIKRRHLKSEEVRQITGRAGRYGVYDIGYAATESGDREIKAALAETPAQLKEAVIGFPEALISIDATMVDLIRKWIQIVPNEGWKKESAEQMLRLARMVEDLHAPKKLEYDFLTIPFDDENEELLGIWYGFFAKEAAGKDYDVGRLAENMLILDGKSSGVLKGLEQQYMVLDLYYNIARKFRPSEAASALIMDKKRICSERITRILEKQKLKGKTCSCCGRSLPWNYPYGMCEGCYRNRRYVHLTTAGFPRL